MTGMKLSLNKGKKHIFTRHDGNDNLVVTENP